jgi:hypothetical protein
MDWNKCEEEFVRQVDEDPQRIQSMIKQAKQRLKRANGTDVSEETVSFIIEDYYEVIKELLVAYLLKSRMRSKNHQCLISYFYKKHPEYETETVLISQMSYFRNRLCYYGESIPVDFYEKNKEKILKIIKLIESLI